MKGPAGGKVGSWLFRRGSEDSGGARCPFAKEVTLWTVSLAPFIHCSGKRLLGGKAGGEGGLEGGGEGGGGFSGGDGGGNGGDGGGGGIPQSPPAAASSMLWVARLAQRV